MNEGRDVIRNAYVPIEAAADLVNMEASTLRGWVADGSLVIERRGDMDVVQLAQVRALASRVATSRHGLLHNRLKQASGSTPSTDLVIITELQDLVRNRIDLPGPSRAFVFSQASPGRQISARNGRGHMEGPAIARPENRLLLILH